MSNVFYFPRYSQRENFVTNNALLLMYRLYEASRRQYQIFLEHLLEESADVPIQAIGFRLQQQISSGTSVLDGYLHQSEVRIGIETKSTGAPFRSDQLLNHLDRFPDGGSGYLLLLRTEKEDLSQKKWDELHSKAKRKGVIVSSTTFRKIIESFRGCIRQHDDDLQELIDDYEDFCAGEGLLDTCDSQIFVPPCGLSYPINESNALYFCPSDWSRRRTRYLGIYLQKAVRLIGEISKIVHCELQNGKLTARNDDGSLVSLTKLEEDRIRAAMHEAEELNGWTIETGHKFYLCDELIKTNYRKATPGGIMGHRYLDISNMIGKKRPTLQELANALAQQTWD